MEKYVMETNLNLPESNQTFWVWKQSDVKQEIT